MTADWGSFRPDQIEALATGTSFLADPGSGTARPVVSGGSGRTSSRRRWLDGPRRRRPRWWRPWASGNCETWRSAGRRRADALRDRPGAPAGLDRPDQAYARPVDRADLHRMADEHRRDPIRRVDAEAADGG